MEKKIKWLAALFAACALSLVLFGCKHSSGGGDDDWVGADSGTTAPAPAKVDIAMVKVDGGPVTGAKHPDVDANASDYCKGVFIADRTVTLSSFYIGKYEVTQEEYSTVMAGQKFTCEGLELPVMSDPSYCKANSSSYQVNFGTEQGKRPVEGVTWYDAVYFCNLLSERNGYAPAYDITVKKLSYIGGSGAYISDADVTLVEGADGYRLPTEAEWEYAARGGNPNDTTNWNYLFSGAPCGKENDETYSSGKNSGLDDVGWYCYNNDTGTTGESRVTNSASGSGTHQVGKQAANALGLHDMSGNVWEWCWDWYGDVSTETVTDPTGASSGSYRVRRGGSWSSEAYYASVCRRGSVRPNNRDSNNNLGFRVVRSAN